MIHSNRAEVHISSDTHPAHALSARLGLTPDEVREKGEPAVPSDPNFGTNSTSLWIIRAPAEVRDDPSGYGALKWIVNHFEGKGQILAHLAGDYEVSLEWWGWTDHWENRVRIPADLMSRVASLSCEFVLTFNPVDPKTQRFLNGID
jgi:hypothetical protein